MEIIVNIFLFPFTLLMWGLKYIIAGILWYIGYRWLLDKYELYTFDWSSLVKKQRKPNIAGKDWKGDKPEDYFQ